MKGNQVSKKEKKEGPSKLVWMDLEMTGLDPDRDVIIEMATLVTDRDLNIIAEGPEIVIQRSNDLFKGMDQWNREHHTKSGLWSKVISSEITEDVAENLTLDFLKQHVKVGESPLCGNSIWQDKRFLCKYMKKLDAHLHYRLIDVSTIKILGKMWYSDQVKSVVEKKSNHRAMDDIRESIEELKNYRKLVFTPLI
jgi:oligoribonuclease